ncbi:protein of unknown function [Actinopolyspora xinjiangensis]|uniref:DUF397 domain-containing protein n=1 Tax=Actinopolyspora xinjiangensis TaxID=405564 RepID=A0A1H0X3P8_9ACTN|nr:DUF397 domain-containing protein [Actinopolyspora xinjiangensis]SDP97086.1 protein of unknown function [Actinopolyspora xinjiangensis]
MTVHPQGWRKASYSSRETDCVEVGHTPNGAAVRDTKDRSAGYFTTTGQQWAAFIDAVKSNRFD